MLENVTKCGKNWLKKKKVTGIKIKMETLPPPSKVLIGLMAEFTPEFIT